MTATFPTHANRIIDPETSDLDALAIFAAQLIAEDGQDVERSSVAAALGMPVEAIEQRWPIIESRLVALAGHAR